MVGANTFRNPGLTAKLATTLDHISDGRAVLGIGGAWFEREHDAFGIDFGVGVGERLDRLDEAVGLIRRLLDGETVDHDGPPTRCTTRSRRRGRSRPHLPILIGGSGPKKTLRTVARYGDAWNTAGTLEEVARVTRSCASTARPSGATRDTIERTVSFPIVIRDRPADGARPRSRRCSTTTASRAAPPRWASRSCSARRTQIAAELRPYRRPRLRDRHRPAAGAVRRRDDRPDRRGPRRARRARPGVTAAE